MLQKISIRYTDLEFRCRSLIIFVFLILTTACKGSPSLPGLVPTPTFTLTPTETLVPTVTPTSTPTPLPPVGVLLAPPQADPGLAANLQEVLKEQIPAAGLRFQVRPSLSVNELNRDQFRWIVALKGTPNLEALIETAPEADFLAIGIEGLEPASNLTTIGGEGLRYDQQGFMAGYIAALITADWRVGMIGLTGLPEGETAWQSFRMGVRYYCGLCLQTYPPFYEYPLYVGLPSGSTSDEWLSVANTLINQSVETVYVMPGVEDEALFRHLAQSGINILAGRTPPEQTLIQELWVASLRYDPLETFVDYWPDFMAGEVGLSLPVPLSITDANANLLSPGRERMAEEVLVDVLDGYIDPGSELP
jgi:hypothetical protein